MSIGPSAKPKKRYREEPCPLMSADGGCELGDEWCGPGDRDCDGQFQWELDQGWHDDGYGEMEEVDHGNHHAAPAR